MQNIIKTPITSISAFDIYSPKQNAVNVDGRPFYSLTYRKSGVAKIIIDNNTIVSEKDCITLIPKHKSYSSHIIEDTNIIALHFDCLDKNAFNTPIVFKSKNQHLKMLFEALYKNYSANDVYNYECYSLFYKILAEVENHFKSIEKNKISPKISRAKSEIEKNFTDSNFNISSLASNLSVSPSYLRREFKIAYSVTPIDYLKNMRHQHSISLLASDYYSVEDVSKECGYCSASYFIQSFHKITGYSPLKYKEKYLDK